jgi:hypothetical protein
VFQTDIYTISRCFRWLLQRPQFKMLLLVATKFIDTCDVNSVINLKMFRNSKALVTAYFEIPFIPAKIKCGNIYSILHCTHIRGLSLTVSLRRRILTYRKPTFVTKSRDSCRVSGHDKRCSVRIYGVMSDLTIFRGQIHLSTSAVPKLFRSTAPLCSICTPTAPPYLLKKNTNALLFPLLFYI